MPFHRLKLPFTCTSQKIHTTETFSFIGMDQLLNFSKEKQKIIKISTKKKKQLTKYSVDAEHTVGGILALYSQYFVGSQR